MADYYNKEADVNQVLIEGNVGNDPTLRFTPSGDAILRLGVATKYPATHKSGKKQELTTWNNVVLWGKAAKAGAKVIKKGTRISVDGRLITSKFKDKDTGKNRYSTDVVVNDDYGYIDVIRGGKSDG